MRKRQHIDTADTRHSMRLSPCRVCACLAGLACAVHRRTDGRGTRHPAGAERPADALRASTSVVVCIR